MEFAVKHSAKNNVTIPLYCQRRSFSPVGIHTVLIPNNGDSPQDLPRALLFTSFSCLEA